MEGSGCDLLRYYPSRKCNNCKNIYFNNGHDKKLKDNKYKLYKRPNRPLRRPRHMWKDGIRMDLG
jgi:hypothetical protein